MKKTGKKRIWLFALVSLAAVSAAMLITTQAVAAANPAVQYAGVPENLPANIDQPLQPAQLPPGIVSAVFVESSTGTDDGVARLLSSMAEHGLHFHQGAAAPGGLIASNSVVILKINGQWDERGGTNTDLIRSVIQAILNHPGGFTGEIIVADNGQGQFGPFGHGGSLNWALNNAVDTSQSVMHVVNSFQAAGHSVTGVLWDEFTTIQVQDFNAGDMRDGFVVESAVRPTGLQISFPKFTTEFGTHVSFREGIWNAAAGSFDSERLKVINMPVLKSHMLFQVTAAVKNYMGIPSDRLTNMGAANRPHNSVGRGGMGTLMVETRMPVLNILDMIWIGPDMGPRNVFANAVQVNKIAASTDAFALDWWGARYVLIPAAATRPGGRHVAMNPDSNEPGTFGHWMRLSMAELHRAGYPATMTPSQILVVDRSS
ncbi:MAG: DUF362 domain-containing protein [Spirochaetes bacterium]|nr:DUF362 domain-containing protein [Spirochaetota bacterium]